MQAFDEEKASIINSEHAEAKQPKGHTRGQISIAPKNEFDPREFRTEK